VNSKSDFYRYLPTTPRDKAWGFYVTAAGRHDVPPNYVSFSDPSGYQLWKTGRVLDDFLVIYIMRGRGILKSKESGEVRINAGDMFMLFPNVRHRFRPDPETGWYECWVMFNGSWPRRLLEHQFITPKEPVVSVGLDSPVGKLFQQIMDGVQSQPTVPNRILAAYVAEMLSYMVCAASNNVSGSGDVLTDIEHAVWYMEEHVDSDIDMEEVAEFINMSYSSFQRHFKRTVGLTPHQYYLRLRTSKAKELLEDLDLSVKQIALQLGFNDPYYFSRLFKKQTGISPKGWRRTAGRRLK